MSFPYAFVSEMKKMLLNLDAWLEKSVAHASQKKFDKDILVQARLAPDAYPLVKQVQAACDSAKFAGARLTGKEAPSHPDDEKTFDELRARIKKATGYLDTLTEKDFEGAEARTVVLPFIPGKGAKAADYLVEMAVPNFMFHVTSAYQILRHNGVPLGKMDFIGSMKLVDV